MKIAVLSCFHPYRGGIAQFNANLVEELGREGHVVRAYNFTTQYPKFLFPGKTQYVEKGDDTGKTPNVRILSTVNPFTWESTARAIEEWGAELLIVRYWMSWFAPSLGYVARHAGCKSIAITDNIIPHEPRFFDTPLTRRFVRSVSGCVTLSTAVQEDLMRLCPGARSTVIPHPVYNHFGEKLPREEAEKILGIPHGGINLLFFGLIRHYKGLDILLRAFDTLPSQYRLIIAGEPYGDFSECRSLIDNSPARNRIFLFDRYIPDASVPAFFSAADATVLPYRSATQSGVNAVALNFEVPMIVTDTGSLRDSVENAGTGIVVEKAEPECVAAGILRFFGTPGLKEKCVLASRSLSRELSWSGFCKRLTSFSETL